MILLECKLEFVGFVGKLVLNMVVGGDSGFVGVVVFLGVSFGGM